MFNFKKYYIMKERIFSDTQLYVSGVAYLKGLHKIVTNMSRDNKKYFGDKLIDPMNEFIMNFSLSYKENNNSRKLQYAIDANYCLDMLEIELDILRGIEILTMKQFSYLFKEIGMLKIQTNGWIKSLENKI